MMEDLERSKRFETSASEETQFAIPDCNHRKELFSNRSVFFLLLVWEVWKSFAKTTARLFFGKTRVTTQGSLTQNGERKRGGRFEDQSIGPERGQQLGTFLVVCLFSIAVAGGIGFIFVYWTGGNNSLLGGSLALCFGGLGFMLVLWAHRLIPHMEAFEERETLPSSTTERKDLSEEFHAGEQSIHRRALLRGMIAIGGGLIAAMIISLFRSLGSSPWPLLLDTVWKRGQRLMTLEGKPVSVNALQPGTTVIVFPENSIGDERAQTILIRVNEQLLQLPAERANWAPSGYVAYSRVCTHAGCPVGMFETTTDLLLCPCHQSTFDVLRAAQPTAGPAARPLPQLPLYADGEGNLRAGGGFSGPPGPGFWGMP